MRGPGCAGPAPTTMPTLASHPSTSRASRGEARVVVTVALGEALVRLGFTPVVAVMPSLAAGLGVEAADGAWIVTAFTLTLAGSLLVSGRLGDLLGHRRLFATGAAVYALAAAVAGLARDFTVVVGACAALGAGAAMLSGNNLAVLVGGVTPARRGRAMGLALGAASVVSLLSATLASLLAEAGRPSAVFLATVPLAAWAVWRARLLPDGPAAVPAAVDWRGAALLTAATTVLAVLLNHPHTAATEAVMPVLHAGLPALAGGLLLALVAVERRAPVPIIEWGQLRSRPLAAATGVNLIIHLTMMATMFLAPVLTVRGLGLGPAAGGMLMVATQATAAVTVVLGGWLHDRARSGWLRPLAAAVLGAGFLGWAVAGAAASYAGLAAAGLLGGVGAGVLVASNNVVMMAALPAGARGVAAGLLETTRHFGHALGMSVSSAILAAAVSGAGDGVAAGYRLGFVRSCLVMAGLAAAAAVLARLGRGRGAGHAAGPEE